MRKNSFHGALIADIRFINRESVVAVCVFDTPDVFSFDCGIIKIIEIIDHGDFCPGF
jgi:hypothetical protein